MITNNPAVYREAELFTDGRITDQILRDVAAMRNLPLIVESTVVDNQLSWARAEYAALVAKRNACLAVLGRLRGARCRGRVWARMPHGLVYRALGSRAVYFNDDLRVDNERSGWVFWCAELGRAQRAVAAANRRLVALV